jgi:hypothetical protein
MFIQIRGDGTPYAKTMCTKVWRKLIDLEDHSKPNFK